jgi:hypothetical protein
MSAAVLTGIGRGSLLAVHTQRPVVISVAACPGPGPVIVQVGDERLVMDEAVMPLMRERWHRDHRQNCSRSKKFDH